jgi:hypothetical protein
LGSKTLQDWGPFGIAQPCVIRGPWRICASIVLIHAGYSKSEKRMLIRFRKYLSSVLTSLIFVFSAAGRNGQYAMKLGERNVGKSFLEDRNLKLC